MRERDKEFYDRLTAASFELDWGDDDSGLFMKYLRRGSGYYIDVGACDLVADGRIKLAHGQVDRLTEDSVVLADGTELPADLVVYATGYGSMNGWAADLIGQEAADKVGKVWGLGSDTTNDPGPWEGELRNMWKPTQQPNLWFHGGNLHQSRHYSLYLALQLKALRGHPHAGLRAARGASLELTTTLLRHGPSVRACDVPQDRERLLDQRRVRQGRATHGQVHKKGGNQRPVTDPGDVEGRRGVGDDRHPEPRGDESHQRGCLLDLVTNPRHETRVRAHRRQDTVHDRPAMPGVRDELLVTQILDTQFVARGERVPLGQGDE
jgi:hypothetical protein